MAPTLGDIGKVAKDVLVGNPKSGMFSTDSKLTFSSKTSDGISFAVTAVNKADKVDGSLKMAYGCKGYSSDATIAPGGAVSVNMSFANILDKVGVPGVKLSGACKLPDPNSGKLTIDYVPCKEFSCKTTLSLLSAPLLDFQGAMVYKGVLLGGETGFDTKSSSITKYNVAAGFDHGAHHLSAHLTDKLSKAKLGYAFVVNKEVTVVSEMVHDLGSSATSGALGFAWKVSPTLTVKAKADCSGTISKVVSCKLASGEMVHAAFQVNGCNPFGSPIKTGFSLDLS